MIDGIEHADNRIELFCDTETRYALPVKPDVWQFLAREREHLPGPVKTRNVVSVGKKTQDGAGTASNFKDGFGLRLVALDEAAGKVRGL